MLALRSIYSVAQLNQEEGMQEALLTLMSVANTITQQRIIVPSGTTTTGVVR